VVKLLDGQGAKEFNDLVEFHHGKIHNDAVRLEIQPGDRIMAVSEDKTGTPGATVAFEMMHERDGPAIKKFLDGVGPSATIRIKLLRTRDPPPLVEHAEATPAEAIPGGVIGGPMLIEEEDDGADELDERDFVEIDYTKSGFNARKSVSAENTHALSATAWDELPNHPKTAEQSARIRAEMKKSFIFGPLNEEETERVILALVEVDKMPNDIIIEEGAEVNSTDPALFMLESGKADVYKKGTEEASNASPHGAKVTEYSQQGATFGELALLYNAPRAATVVAAEQCKMWALDRTSFAALVQGAMQKRHQETEGLLSQLDFLKAAVEERAKLADVIHTETFDAGAVVVTQGGQGNNMYIVKSGKLEAKVDGEVVMSYGHGNYFGELALLSGSSGVRHATVEVVEPSVLLSIDRQAYDRLLGNADKLLAEKATAVYGDNFVGNPTG
jgi:cAMP-dependent protein kinase regulator